MKTVHPFLDKDKQIRAKQYEKEKRTLSLLSMSLSLAFLLMFYFSGLSAWLSQLFPGSLVIRVFLAYMVAFQFMLVFVSFPLSFYSGYVHEHKWKFSNHTPGSWLLEQTKSFLVGLVIFTALVGMLFRIWSSYPQSWWWIAGLTMAAVNVIFSMLFPVVVFPVFNKYTPIKEKELTDSLEKILEEGGLKNSGFFLEDMSRQTKKENAFLAGLGKTRRVILGDNLLRNMSFPEIESIIAHEVGHFKHKHIWRQMTVGTIQQLFVFFILNFAMREFFPYFLTSTRANLSIFPLFVIFLAAISSLLFNPLNNGLSRHFEKQADRYALSTISNPGAFMTAMAGLADRNLSNAYPEWWMKLLFYSHPPVGERLHMAEDWGHTRK